MPQTDDIKTKIANSKNVSGLDAVRIVEAVTREKDELEARVKKLETTGGQPVRVRRNRGM